MNPVPLHPIERMLLTSNLVAPLNVVVVMHFESPVTRDELRARLDLLQHRYEALCVRIQILGNQPHFFADVQRPVPLTIVDASHPETWRGVAEHCLNEPIPAEQGPLMMCTLVRREDGGGCSIVLNIHHTIIDGTSLLPMLNDFLRPIASLESTPAPEVKQTDVIHRLPTSYRGLRKLVNLTGFLLRQAADELIYGLNSRKHPPTRLQYASRLRTSSLELSKEETTAVVCLARGMGVTVNSALHAAACMAYARITWKNMAAPVRLITFADLRPYLEPPLRPEDPGCCFSMLRITGHLADDETFHAFARRIHEGFVKAYRRGDKFASFLLADDMIRGIIRLNAVRLGTTALSYSGPLTLVEDLPVRSLTGFHTFISNNRFGPPFAAQARIFHDRLQVDAVYMEADMEGEAMHAVLREMRSLLTGNGT